MGKRVVLIPGVLIGLLWPVCATAAAAEKMPEQVRGIYLTSGSFGERTLAEYIHYAKHTGLNAMVLHVKDPYGHIHWQSTNATAQAIGAVKGRGRLEAAVNELKKNEIWAIAKLDVFQDTLLAQSKPEWAVLDRETKKPWGNKDNLCWTNPYDARVWNHTIALAKELVALGFDEIQFDYIRFPSDGNLGRIVYPVTIEGKNKLETIGAFLEAAHAELKPLGAALSVDLFGFVAWKTDDFGVGQRIEEIAPHVDAICPMLYPSHFPKGFLGKPDPSKIPYEIMERSMKNLAARTQVAVRPWIQGFWYQPDEIIAQVKGIEATGLSSYLVWNPASNYTVSFTALAKHLNVTVPEPKLYPALADLEQQGQRTVQGATRVVHLSDYRQGFSVLTLEPPQKDGTASFSTPNAVVATLDEAVMDQILKTRGIKFSTRTGKQEKTRRLVELLCRDLGAKPSRLSTEPMRVDWKGPCVFTRAAQTASDEAQKAAAAPDQEGPQPSM